MSRCAYLNCTKTRRESPMFTFPAHDKDRLRLWIIHSGNTNLTSLTDNELSHRFICAAHFHPDSIHQGEKRCRLLGPAVPIHYQFTDSDGPSHLNTRVLLSPEVLKVKTPTKFYRRNRTTGQADLEQSSSTSPSLFGGPFSAPSPLSRRMSRKSFFEEPCERPSRKLIFEKSKNEEKTQTLMKKTKAMHSKLRRLQSAKSKLQRSCINIEKHNFNSKVSKTLALMQLKNKNLKKWTQEEKDFCLSLFYKSPTAYKFLCRQGVILAAPTTIRSWLYKSSCLPGLSGEVFIQIGRRFENASMKEKSCVVCFDEMAIMSKLDYTKKFDMIEGFEDLGGNRRSNKMAKNVLVFLARGLYAKWKFPVAYFLSSTNLKANDLELLVKAVLNKLFNCGLLPKAVVCDQMSTNQKIYQKFGVSINHPFFFCGGRKIFAFYDMPHLIKSVRNNFIRNNFIIGRDEVSFQDIVKTCEIDKKSTQSRCLLKITEKHLNPNAFQKMTVSLATQIFSHSVSAAIRTAKTTNQLTSETAYKTSEFIETVNNMFDGMNSRSKFEKNACRCALTKNMTHSRKALLKGKKTFQEIHKITIKKDKNAVVKKVLTRPPCFDGIVQTIEATLQLFHEESTEPAVKFLITNKLNQDVIENLFSLFRQKGGSNRNPSASVLRGIFRSNLVNSLIKLPDTRNCEEDDSKFIRNVDTQELNEDESTSSVLVSSKDHFTNPDASSSYPVMLQNDPDATQSASASTSQAHITTLEDCAVYYFAGYLAKVCLDKFKCTSCETKLVKDFDLDDEKQLLILHKTFGFMNTIKLKTPSDILVTLIEMTLVQFNTKIEGMIHLNHLKAKLFDSIIIFLRCEAEELLGFTCQEHVYFIIQHLLLVKIFSYCKTMKNNTSMLKVKPQAKLQILKNL